MESSLLVLKLRLLLGALDEVPDSEVHANLILQADLAVAEARDAGFPELIFPCLFQERLAQALAIEQSRNRNYWYTLVSPSADSLVA